MEKNLLVSMVSIVLINHLILDVWRLNFKHLLYLVAHSKVLIVILLSWCTLSKVSLLVVLLNMPLRKMLKSAAPYVLVLHLTTMDPFGYLSTN